ncbi:QcrA and Rieske domain-containing protein [Kytococcus sp. Marseille-QA3725]
MTRTTGCSNCPGSHDPATGPTRRQVVTGAGAAAAFGVPALSACGGGEGAKKPAAADLTVPSSEVPVGSGVIKDGWVVTQPSEGEFKAFTDQCTHQGCAVTQVDGEKIICTCHGSEFSIEDGSPTAGPATEPLEAGTVEESGDELKVGAKDA